MTGYGGTESSGQDAVAERKRICYDIVIGPITIHMYGVMIAAGFLAALLMTLQPGQKERL